MADFYAKFNFLSGNSNFTRLRSILSELWPIFQSDPNNLDKK